MIATRGSRSGVRPRPAVLPRRDEDRLLGPDEPQRHDVRGPVGVRGRHGRRGQAREHATRRAHLRVRDPHQAAPGVRRSCAIWISASMPSRTQRRVAERSGGARDQILDGGDGLGPGFAVGDVIPELERLPHQPPEHPQRTLGLRPGPGERRADQHRAFGGVRSGLQRANTSRFARARDVEELPGRHLGPHAVEAGHRRIEPAGPEPARAKEPLGQHERQIAHQDRRRRPERLRVHTGRRLLREPDVGRVDAAALGVPIHQVVVHEGGRVQELERRADRDDRVAFTAAGRSERPPAQRRPNPLPAGAEQAEQLVHQGDRRRVHPGQLRAAVAQEPLELAVDRCADGLDRRRWWRGRGAILRRHAGSMPTRDPAPPPPAPLREACCYRSDEPRLER